MSQRVDREYPLAYAQLAKVYSIPNAFTKRLNDCSLDLSES